MDTARVEARERVVAGTTMARELGVRDRRGVCKPRMVGNVPAPRVPVVARAGGESRSEAVRGNDRARDHEGAEREGERESEGPHANRSPKSTLWSTLASFR